jgi:hypothetical protein
LVQPTGIEPVSMALQTTAMTTSARVAYWYLVTGLNRRHSTCKEDATTAELTRQIYFGELYENRTRDNGITTRGFATKLITPQNKLKVSSYSHHMSPKLSGYSVHVLFHLDG